MNLFLFLTSFVFASFIGYWIHRILHYSKLDLPYQIHLNHHTKQYPPTDYLSTSYRSAGKYSTVYLFIAASVPLILILFFLYFTGLLSIFNIFCITLGTLSSGILHDYAHNMFHVSPCKWEKYNLFLKLRELHRVHHEDMNSNFGIFVFAWDKLFKTFKSVSTKKEE